MEAVDDGAAPADIGIRISLRRQGPKDSVCDCETGGAGEAPADARAGSGAGGDPARGQRGRLPGLPPGPRAAHVSQPRPAQAHLHADQGRVRAGRPGRAARHQEGRRRLRHPARQPPGREPGQGGLCPPGTGRIHVDPAFTSQQCSSCGQVDRRNRLDQASFSCTSCGFAEHADVNAARNIARGEMGWAVSHAA
ncbi:zinc ribbon domain-containing protein [Streptosporangium sp. NPDC000563]|uniref:zinc ribbon domain-containing protein n=1 Tax=Streptosporangium sp. NPDC000563 TaxID=3154366 RepID=UPI003332E22F